MGIDDWETMMANLYYAPDGTPINQARWVELWSDPDIKRVAETTVGDFWISTVYLGLDHGLGWKGEGHQPLIFETMVFDHSKHGESASADLDMQRYSSSVQALAGHDQMVEKVKGWTGISDDIETWVNEVHQVASIVEGPQEPQNQA